MNEVERIAEAELATASQYMPQFQQLQQGLRSRDYLPQQYKETFGSELVILHKPSYADEFMEKLWECFWMLVTRICAGIGVGLGFVGTLWIVKYITDWGV